MTRAVLTPSLSCDNVDKSYEHFTSVLGWAGQGKMPGPDGQTMHAEVIYTTKTGEARIMLGPKAMAENAPEAGPFGVELRAPGALGKGVMLYVNTANVDKYFDFVRANRADIVTQPKDQFWGFRDFTVRTLDGYFITFGQPIKGFKWPPGTESSVHDARKATAPGLPKKLPEGMIETTKPKAKTAKPANVTKATKGKTKSRWSLRGKKGKR